MSGIDSDNDPSSSVAQYPALVQMELVPPSGADVTYENLLAEILTDGTTKFDHTDTGTRSLFAHQLRYDLHRGLPRIITEFVTMKVVKDELLWFSRRETNVRWLQGRGITIQDEWVNDSGKLRPVYGLRWRLWPIQDGGAINRITGLIDTLRTDPGSQHMLVSAWNISELRSMALAPCHIFFQRCVVGGRLGLQIYQHNADLPLGVPFSITLYALLAHMPAQQAGLEPGELVWTGGGYRVYNSHIGQVRTQLSRMSNAHPFLTLRLERAEPIDSYDMNDIDASQGYEHHPTIKVPVAVRAVWG